jgi:hypothetical protein
MGDAVHVPNGSERGVDVAFFDDEHPKIRQVLRGVAQGFVAAHQFGG